MIGPVQGAAGIAGLCAGGGVLVTAAIMLTRTLRPTLETREYVRDIHGATDRAVENLNALAGLEDTRERTAALARALEPAGADGP